MYLLGSLVAFIILIGILVVVHEFGHYYIARRNGVKIEVFSFGFGPEIFGWTDDLGTRWKVSWIPLGGYVRMFGDADASSARADKAILAKASDELKKQSIYNKTPWQRLAISIAGPAANIAFAFLLLVFLGMISGVPYLPTKVGDVKEDSLAQKIGIAKNDQIISINDIELSEFNNLRSVIVNEGKRGDLRIKILRQHDDGTSETFVLTARPEMDEAGHIKPLGIKPSKIEYMKLGFFQGIRHSCYEIYSASAMLIQGLASFVFGGGSKEDMGSIISIGYLAGESLRNGIADFIFVMALLSINLGVINLLPIPVLDGGHILFSLIEGIRGRPVSEKVQEYSFFVGLAIVLSLMAISTWSDVKRFKIFTWFDNKIVSQVTGTSPHNAKSNTNPDNDTAKAQR